MNTNSYKNNIAYKYILNTYFKFDDFRPGQKEIIDAIIFENRDVCVTMFTGAGKSLCYQFPAVFLRKTCFVVSPLISLMRDQQLKLTELNIPATFLNSTTENRFQVYRKILDNKFRVVYITPETLVNCKNLLQKMMNNKTISMIAIDESHCVSTWGNDFRDAYRDLGTLRDWLIDVPIVTFTATATNEVKQDIVKLLKLNNPLMIQTTYDRPNLNIFINHKTTIFDDLKQILFENEPTIIYCQTRDQTEEIANIVSTKIGIECLAYHAGLSSNNRDIIHKKFITNKISCISATVAFGMGIDTTIRKIIHYGSPKDIESYYQEIGRAGRDGKKANCFLFYSNKDFSTNKFLLSKIENEFYREHKLKILDIIKKYIYSSKCRRKFILNYFNENYTNNNCGMCDNCCRQNILVDYTEELILLLAIIKNLDYSYGSSLIVNILRGSKNKKIPHHIMKTVWYGKGAIISELWWKLFIKVVLTHDLLTEKSFGTFGSTLYITDKGKQWLKNTVSHDKLTPKIGMEHSFTIVPPADLLKLNKSNKSNDSNTHTNLIKNNNNLIKNNTVDITFNMLKTGKSPNQIAKDRNVLERTIEEHMCQLYQLGKITCQEIGLTDDVFESTKNVIIKLNNPDKLRVIKKALPDVSYLDIKLTKIKMNQQV